MNRKSTGIGKEEQQFPGWGNSRNRRGERPERYVGGANVLESGKVDEARLKAKAA